MQAMVRRKPTLMVTAGLLSALLFGCATVPYTKRSQLVLVPQSEEISLGAQAYREILSKAVIVRNPEFVDPVRRVGERIARAADQPDYRWEFTVIDDDSMINAFALPGGKVAVYTGIFPVAQDEAGLAAVIGHEVAHALAHHGAERMSQGLLAQIGAVGLSVALGGSDPQTANAIMQAYGLGAEYGVLKPFSRGQESEADHIGLILMSKAGYDPHAALGIWERMEKLNEKVPPEFLSTHPSYGTRITDIRRWLPEAERYYKPDDVKNEKLPALVDLEEGADHGEAACKRYARTIDQKAVGPQGQRVFGAAIAEVMGLSPQTVTRRQSESGFSLGEVAVASALAKAGAGPFEQVAAAYKKERRWSATARNDDGVIKEALGLLRATLVAARGGTAQQSRGGP